MLKSWPSPLPDSDSRKSQLTGHTLKSKTNNPYGTRSIFDMLQILYLDDEAFIFACREDLIKGIKMIDKQFKKFGMEMHVGQNEKESKSECMSIPPQAFFKDILLPIHDESDTTSQVIVKLLTVSEIQKVFERHRSLKYYACPHILSAFTLRTDLIFISLNTSNT